MLALSAAPLASASLALDVIIMRQAETLAEGAPGDSPFNQRHFTETGLNQIAEWTDLLRGQRFDAILVSPAYSALRTIQPYLEEASAQAEIWPDLKECCRQTDRTSERTPPGEPILLEANQRPYFLLREGAPDVAPGNETYADGVRRAHLVAEQIRARWAGSDARVLVVTHERTGAQLLEALLGSPPKPFPTVHKLPFVQVRLTGNRFVPVDATPSARWGSIDP